MIKIPVKNKTHFEHLFVAIALFIVVIAFSIFRISHNNLIIYVSLILLIVWISISLIYIHFQKVKKAYLGDDSIIVYYKNKEERIPLDCLIDIKGGMHLSYNFRISTSFTFILYFNRKFRFGKRLFLNYDSDKNLLDFEPQEIKLLKSKLSSEN